MLRPMGVQRTTTFAVLVLGAVLLGGCGSPSGAPSPATDRSASAPPPSEAAAAPEVSWELDFTDCDALEPGDELNFEDFACHPDNARQWQSMDCKSGVYVRLTGSTTDLEGITGQTTWLAAEAMDPRYGRTPWAFANCLEHG